MQLILDPEETQEYLTYLENRDKYPKIVKGLSKEFQKPPYQDKKPRIKWKEYEVIINAAVNSDVFTLETLWIALPDYVTKPQLKAYLKRKGITITEDNKLIKETDGI